MLHIAVNTNVSEGFVFTAISSTKQILCQNSNICCGVSTFKLRKLNQIILLQGITEAINSRMSTYYETEIVLNSNLMLPEFYHIIKPDLRKNLNLRKFFFPKRGKK